jgi:LmbE family N-acetylglucosaminyl deacetylase
MTLPKNIFLLVVLLVSLIFAEGEDKPRKCIMVFGTHADDVEQMAGGTFAKFIADGYQGIYVCVENNLSGNRIEKIPGNWDYEKREPTLAITGSPKMYQVDALETSQLRQEEALRAAKVFGAQTVFLNFVEPELSLGRFMAIYGTGEYIKYNPPGRMHTGISTRTTEDVNVIVELLKKYKPEIVIIHSLGGEKFDHAESSYLVYLAFKKAVSQNIGVGRLWMRINGWMLDPDAQNTGTGKPDVRIDITNNARIKYEAYSKHVSQKGSVNIDQIIKNLMTPEGIFEEFITVLDNTK